ncbi:MAG: FkbM family methyltransferase [Chlamydiae bacterium]|nr:FkbM family methyltransferase [Chlamydiota bacterium]
MELQTVFEIDEKTTIVPNYYYQHHAEFITYKRCMISDKLKNGRLWEPHLHKVFKSYITKNSIVLEAGCHIGTHSILLSKLCKHLICFEPLFYSASILEKNLQINNCKNVTLHKKALSDTLGKNVFSSIRIGNVGESLLHKKSEDIPTNIPDDLKLLEIEMTTLDELKLNQLDFIKLDVEEFEPKIIKGGMKTIKKYKPVISLECSGNAQNPCSLENTIATFPELIALGYKVIHVEHCDFLFIPE